MNTEHRIIDCLANMEYCALTIDYVKCKICGRTFKYIKTKNEEVSK